MHVQVRINRKVKMKSTKTQCYVAEKFRERYPKIQLRSSSQRSTQLPFESGTSRAISTVAILLCLSFLVSLVLQCWSVRSSKRKGLQETKQELLFHSNQDQFVRGCLRGRCLGTLKHVSLPKRLSCHSTKERRCSFAMQAGQGFTYGQLLRVYIILLNYTNGKSRQLSRDLI